MRQFRQIAYPAIVMLLCAPVLGAKPSGPKPAGNPGDWVTSDDYPPAALRESQKGMTAFRLDVDASGHVAGCTVTKSSGFAVLDETSCSLLKVRATFAPATDKRGRPIAAIYSSAIRWQIPEGDGMPKISMISCAFGGWGDIQVSTPEGCVR